MTSFRVTIQRIKGLVELFRERCSDKSTFDEILSILDDEAKWAKAHDLFDRIREKTLSAERKLDKVSEVQCLFEEVVAETLYNFSYSAAPFDPDAPFWIVPNAISLARVLSIEENEVIRIITST